MALAFSCVSPVPRSSAELDAVAYVWQPTGRADVREAMARAAPRLAGFWLLAGEITWDGAVARLAPVPIDPAAIPDRRVGLVIRIRQFSGDFEATARSVADRVGERVDAVAALGGRIDEVQLDFDAPTRVLAGYPAWISAVRSRVNRPVTITSLPTWLSSPAWDDVCAAADGFTLQVHGFEAPEGRQDLRPLFTPRAAVAAVEQASLCGRPFRVALPTYTWIVAFEGDRVLGVFNERPPPARAHLETVRSKPEDALSVLRALRDHPANLQGVSWFRLPVRGDTAAWSWPTLVAVLEARLPEPAISASCAGADPLLCEVVVRNDGDADSGPFAVTIQAEAPFVAADATSDYPMDQDGERARYLSPSDGLQAGASRAIGWVRLSRRGASASVGAP